jgi:hypothetical protein
MSASKTPGLTEAELAQRKRAALTHGGEAAIKRLQNGEPFDGLALAAYEGVLDELGVDLDALTGLDRVRVKRAARFEAVARLFDGAALAAAAAGELDRWERYQQRAGWIGGRAFKALTELRETARGDGALDYERILAEKNGGK